MPIYRSSTPLLALAAAILLVFAGLGSTVLGQTTPEFDDAQLDAYAASYVEINEIAEEYGPRIQNAETEQQARALQDQANSEMVMVIRRNGLDVPTYNEIADTMRIDRDLHDDVMQRVEDARG